MIGQWAEIIEDGGKSKLSRVPRFNWFPATATASCLLFSCSWICLLSPMRELHFLTSICAMNWWCAVKKWKMCDKKVEDTTSCGFETIFGISTPIPGEVFCNLTCALFFFWSGLVQPPTNDLLGRRNRRSWWAWYIPMMWLRLENRGGRKNGPKKTRNKFLVLNFETRIVGLIGFQAI